jgi:hypothetical protein
VVLAAGSWVEEEWHDSGVLTTARPEVTGDVLSSWRQSWRLWWCLGTSSTLCSGWCLRSCSTERTGCPRTTAMMLGMVMACEAARHGSEEQRRWQVPMATS